MAWRSATAPLAALPELWKTMFPIFTDPGSSITVWGVMVPVWSAATLVMTLKVDPVGYRPAMARSYSGAPFGGGLQLLERGLLDRLGEDVRIEATGTEPMARISPLRGSMATNAPGSPPPTDSERLLRRRPGG